MPRIELHASSRYELGNQSYHSARAVYISDNCLIGMFHSNTPDHNKEVILKSFTGQNGVVRAVFAIVAVEMVVNLRGVNYGGPERHSEAGPTPGPTPGPLSVRCPSAVIPKLSGCLSNVFPVPFGYFSAAFRVKFRLVP